MKKILLSLFALSSLISFAQISLVKHNGTPILDGDIITFTEAVAPQASLDFYVQNNTSSPILTRILFVSATNYSGTGFQLCYLVDCYDNITVGQYYPTTDFAIPANGQNGNFDHFLNYSTGDGTNYPMDFVFKLYAVDSAGVEFGTPINFTYRFDPTLNNTDFNSLQNLGVEIKNTLVEDNLELTTTKNTSIAIFDINGKKVYAENLVSGNQVIDLSSLSSNIYFLNVTTENNQTASIKIIKK